MTVRAVSILWNLLIEIGSAGLTFELQFPMKSVSGTPCPPKPQPASLLSWKVKLWVGLPGYAKVVPRDDSHIGAPAARLSKVPPGHQMGRYALRRSR